MKHTPGPWVIEGEGDSCSIVNRDFDEDGWDIAEVYSGFSNGNARLIAAAPDLLEALIQMVANAEADGKTYRDCYKNAVEAISKAKGE